MRVALEECSIALLFILRVLGECMLDLLGGRNAVVFTEDCKSVYGSLPSRICFICYFLAVRTLWFCYGRGRRWRELSNSDDFCPTMAARGDMRGLFGFWFWPFWLQFVWSKKLFYCYAIPMLRLCDLCSLWLRCVYSCEIVISKESLSLFAIKCLARESLFMLPSWSSSTTPASWALVFLLLLNVLVDRCSSWWVYGFASIVFY